MYELWIAPFADFDFMLRALLGSVFLALIAAPLGVFLIFRRLSLVADAMSHAILPGVALGFLWAGSNMLVMLLGGMATGLVVALLAALVAKYTQVKEDASFATFYLISLALGVLLISIRGSGTDLLHILFGSVLSIDDQALLFVMVMSSLSALVLAVIYRPLVIECFDSLFLQVQGKKKFPVSMVFVVLLVINLVAGFQVLGTLMVVGMMILPAVTARFLGRTLGVQVVLSSVLAIVSVYLGLVVSYAYDLPSSSLIILISGAFYIVAMLFGPYGGFVTRYFFSKQ